MGRLIAGAAALALAGCVATHGQRPECPACVYGPHAETVKHTAYGAREEPFCLRRVSPLGPAGADCGECLPPRAKTRLLKWEESEERVTMRCAIDPAPAPPGQPLR